MDSINENLHDVNSTRIGARDDYHFVEARDQCTARTQVWFLHALSALANLSLVFRFVDWLKSKMDFCKKIHHAILYW